MTESQSTLWDRVAENGGLWDWGLGVFALLLFSTTLAPGLLPADSGEYQTTGALLGVAHPPGFALYTLLSWLISRLSFVSPALAINFLSAMLAALTLALVGRAVRAWTGSPWAGWFAALILGAATTFWAQATTANIRMFTAFAVALALAGLADYERDLAAGAGRPTGPGRPTGSPLRVALGLGLAVSHHGSTVFLAAALGLYLLALDPRVLSRPAVWAAGLAPFLAWLYFPLRAGAFGSPPNARTWDGFLDQVLARGWSGDMLAFATPEALPDRLRVLGVLLEFQWNGALLGLMALGAVLTVLADRRRGAAFLAAFGVHVFIAITYRAPQTTEYLLPAYVLMAVFAGFAGARVFRFPGSRRRRALSFALAAAGLVALGAQFAARYPAYRALAQDDSTRAYAAAVLEAAPPGALILASWHWVTPLWYLREVEGARPDVAVRYVVPRTASYGQDWTAEIGAGLAQRAVIVTSYFKPEYAASGYRFRPLATPGGEAWEARAAPLVEPPPDLTGARSFDGLEFLGFRLLPGPAAARAVDVLAAWRVSGDPQDISFFVHALGPDGRLYGQSDVSHPASSYAAGEVLVDRYVLNLSPEALPGPYALAAGAYRPDGARVAETTLLTWEVGASAAPPPTAHPQWRAQGGATLVGADVDRSLADAQRVYLHWQLGPAAAEVSAPDGALTLPAGPGYATTAADLPPDQALPGLPRPLPPDPSALSRYVPFGHELVLTRADFAPRAARPGEAVSVELEFLAARPITRDLVVKVELTGAGWRVQQDTVPVGGALPTLKWLPGARLRDRYTLVVPADALPGPARLVVGWYDAFTQRDLPILDPRLARLGPTVALGEIEIRP